MRETGTFSRASRCFFLCCSQAGITCSREFQARWCLCAQPLLHAALTRLLGIASGAAAAPELAGLASTAPGEMEGTEAEVGVGSWPRVHALNMVRLVFEERALATDTLPFLAEGAASGA